MQTMYLQVHSCISAVRLMRSLILELVARTHLLAHLGTTPSFLQFAQWIYRFE